MGIASVLVALMPWLLTGLRMPLQRLWAPGALPAESPAMLLPLNQYYLMTLAGLVLTAGAISGLVARGAPPEKRRRSGDLSALGVLLALGGCAVQSAAAFSGMRSDDGSGRALVLFLVWVLVSSAGAVVVLLLLARSTRAGACVAAAIAAPAAGVWLSALSSPDVVISTAVVSSGDLRWAPAVLVGLALAWCGLRTRGRISAWVMSMVLLWVVPALLTAISAAAAYRGGTEGFARTGAALDVLGYSLRPELAFPPVVLAGVVGLVGTGTLLVLERFRPGPAPASIRPEASTPAARPTSSQP